MNAYCPECETELDQATGICPACRWDPYTLSTEVAPSPQRELSLSERYRGTTHDASWDSVAAHQPAGISRARVFVIAGLLGVVGFYGIILGILGVS